MATPYNYFAEQLAVITATLEMLNKDTIPDDKLGGFHIEVRLKDEDGNVVGVFSDEIASDAWYYQPLAEPFQGESLFKGV